VLNSFLKVAKLILMRDLEKLWVTFRKTQCEFEILSLLVLCQPKPTHDVNALKGEMIGNERIDVRAYVALQ
jgi:hypothetical protein